MTYHTPDELLDFRCQRARPGPENGATPRPRRPTRRPTPAWCRTSNGVARGGVAGPSRGRTAGRGRAGRWRPRAGGNDPGEGDPDVVVEEPLVGRAGGRVVLDPRALDVRAVTLGRGIIQGEPQGAVGVDGAEGVAEQPAGQQFDAAAEGG